MILSLQMTQWFPSCVLPINHVSWYSLSRAFAGANVRKSLRKSFATVVMAFLETSYFNAPSNDPLEDFGGSPRVCWSVLYKEAAPRHVVPPRSSSIAPVLNQVLWVHDHLEDLIMESWLFDVGLPAWHILTCGLGLDWGAMTCKETIQTRKYIYIYMNSYEECDECDGFAYYTYYTSCICKPQALPLWLQSSRMSRKLWDFSDLSKSSILRTRWAYQNTTVPSHKYWLIMIDQ
jgi:hypothetical protein